MAVHYERGFIGKVKELGLRPATIDIGGGITFQGGVSQRRQIELMRLIGELQAEYDTMMHDHKQTAEVVKSATVPIPIPPPITNGIMTPTVPPTQQPQPTAHPVGKKPTKS